MPLKIVVDHGDEDSDSSSEHTTSDETESGVNLTEVGDSPQFPGSLHSSAEWESLGYPDDILPSDSASRTRGPGIPTTAIPQSESATAAPSAPAPPPFGYEQPHRSRAPPSAHPTQYAQARAPRRKARTTVDHHEEYHQPYPGGPPPPGPRPEGWGAPPPQQHPQGYPPQQQAYAPSPAPTPGYQQPNMYAPNHQLVPFASPQPYPPHQNPFSQGYAAYPQQQMHPGMYPPTATPSVSSMHSGMMPMRANTMPVYPNHEMMGYNGTPGYGTPGYPQPGYGPPGYFPHMPHPMAAPSHPPAPIIMMQPPPPPARSVSPDRSAEEIERMREDMRRLMDHHKQQHEKALADHKSEQEKLAAAHKAEAEKKEAAHKKAIEAKEAEAAAKAKKLEDDRLAAEAKKAYEKEIEAKIAAARKAGEEAAAEKHKKTTAEEKVKAEEEAKKAKEAAEKKAKADAVKKTIKFKDAINRKFVFPYDLCATWEGMEALIQQAFQNVDDLEDMVLDGHYDLIGPNGDIMLPQIWDRMIEPDQTIQMNMWSITRVEKEERKRHGPPPGLMHGPPQPQPRDRRSLLPNILMMGPSRAQTMPLPGHPMGPPPGHRPGHPPMMPAGAPAGLFGTGLLGGGVNTLPPEPKPKKEKKKESAPLFVRMLAPGAAKKKSSSSSKKEKAATSTSRLPPEPVRVKRRLVPVTDDDLPPMRGPSFDAIVDPPPLHPGGPGPA